MRKNLENKSIWPSWRYGPNGEAEIFHCEEDIPEGWMRKPGTPEPKYDKSQPVQLDKEELYNHLIAKDVIPAGNWSAAYMKELLEQ